MAKEIGLGHCGAVEPSPPAIEPPVTQRGGCRPRRAPPATRIIT